MKHEYEEDRESDGYDATVLDYANIELLDEDDGRYEAENGNFGVTREAENRFVLDFRGQHAAFSSAALVISALKQ